MRIAPEVVARVKLALDERISGFSEPQQKAMSRLVLGEKPEDSDKSYVQGVILAQDPLKKNIPFVVALAVSSDNMEAFTRWLGQTMSETNPVNALAALKQGIERIDRAQYVDSRYARDVDELLKYIAMDDLEKNSHKCESELFKEIAFGVCENGTSSHLARTNLQALKDMGEFSVTDAVLTALQSRQKYLSRLAASR